MKTTISTARLCGTTCTASAKDLVIAGCGGNVEAKLSRTLRQFLAWRTDVYGDNPSEDRSDLRDVDAFPGRKSPGAAPQEIALLSADGAPVAFTYTDGVLGGMLKGSHNIALAHEFVAGAASAKLQARIPEMMPYSSTTNSDAFVLSTADPAVLEDCRYRAEERRPSCAANFKWWSVNLPEMDKKYAC